MTMFDQSITSLQCEKSSKSSVYIYFKSLLIINSVHLGFNNKNSGDFMKNFLSIFIFIALFTIGCEDSNDENDNQMDDINPACNSSEAQLEQTMWTSYYQLIDESATESGVTEETCSATKDAIQNLRDCVSLSNDPDLKEDVDNASDWTNSVCN